jgi:glycerol kinase
MALILAIDAGTTSSRAIVFDADGRAHCVAQAEFAQHFPADGWVEHDPDEIWATTVRVCRDAMARAGEPVAAIGITNQRETTVVWDRATGVPIYNAIVWQDRRTADLCETLHDRGHLPKVRAATGLLLDPYFCATKVRWILDNVDGARERAARGELAFGTIDTFLIWRLTGARVHATDATNAARTMLFNIHTQQWDRELLELFDVPANMLPDVRDSAADFGVTEKSILGSEVAICGVAGDQQAASFGQACFAPGMVKSTYGTGCFVLMNTGGNAPMSQNRLLTTVAYRLNGETTYALEGSIFVAGAAIQWLRDGLGLIESASESAELAMQARTDAEVYLVPAFTGLGAPYWDPHARGAVFGLTRDTGAADFVRAALDAVCYQTHDLVTAMVADRGAPLESVRVDGGMVGNDWLMQRLADIIDVTVERPAIAETTALGVAYLAGLQAGIFAGLDTLTQRWHRDAIFTPQLAPSARNRMLDGWAKAITRVRSS